MNNNFQILTFLMVYWTKLLKKKSLSLYENSIYETIGYTFHIPPVPPHFPQIRLSGYLLLSEENMSCRWQGGIGVNHAASGQSCQLPHFLLFLWFFIF